MGSIVHRSLPTNLKWLPNCSHAHALFQDRFKDVQVGSRWFSTLYILSPNFHMRGLQARWLTGCLLGLVAANALLEDEVEASVLFHFEFPADSPSILHFHPRSWFSYCGLAGQGPGEKAE